MSGQPHPVASAGEAHVTSSPSGGDIYVDGRFYGNTPADITLPTGEHIVKVTIGIKEWSRTVQITTGEIRLHAEVAEK
jgi:PEGA domain